MKLRPYQQQVAKAVLDSIRSSKGLTLSVEIARQGGKNELSAHLEVLLLTLYMAQGGTIVKCSPTFKPQTIISMQRLKERLDEFGFDGIYHTEMGYIICLGTARQIFLSAEESSSVVGHTADILLEIDESQDVSKEKYTKEFRPMGSSTNVTTVHYGTTWDDSTLLEQIKQTNLELEKRDGVKRHFRYDWQEVAKDNPEYGRYVESERTRLGEDHPLFRTQYALLPISGGGGFLTRQQIVSIMGSHPRLKEPQGVREAFQPRYVAGIDLAGEREQDRETVLTAAKPKLDSTVITIAELDIVQRSHMNLVEPTLKVVEHYQWTGTPHSQLYAQIVNVLKKWECHRVLVDATGIGQPVASFLRKEIGSRVVPFTFTQKSKSEMGFELLSFVNSGRLRLYKQDGSDEYRELMFQLEKARAQYRPNQTMNFYVDPQDGHDDFLMSLALAVEAARGFSPRTAKGLPGKNHS
ncbi:MAG: hypothetical protein E3J42_06875 [Dehalococcoidia bacterium]|nr:MAG: hypothetical protein E3J42_06875 [Dehalococcoidia bacterium]